MSTKPVYDKADAQALFDDRGYTGALIRGQNPALLLEKGLRERIVESMYWKEQCFGLNAATLCDRAAELKFVGGTTGITGKPTPFICLVLKMLSLVPPKEIVLEMLNYREDEDEDEDIQGSQKDEEDEWNGDSKEADDLNAKGKLGAFKYLRVLAAFYIRLAWEPVEIYTTLEPLLLDYRRVRRRQKDGFVISTIDQLVDDMLTQPRLFATSLWKMQERSILEDLELIEPRESPLADERQGSVEVEVKKSKPSQKQGQQEQEQKLWVQEANE
ncbi:hypothetical protein N0V90_007675 [Kalmusia sp. IMI 367209]|nr:hypothetical protein N0V90_007675 [Kalmusia sp. IMI 367209]